jgi:hypothetical protein
LGDNWNRLPAHFFSAIPLFKISWPATTFFVVEAFAEQCESSRRFADCDQAVATAANCPGLAGLPASEASANSETLFHGDLDS